MLLQVQVDTGATLTWKFTNLFQLGPWVLHWCNLQVGNPLSHLWKHFSHKKQVLAIFKSLCIIPNFWHELCAANVLLLWRQCYFSYWYSIFTRMYSVLQVFTLLGWSGQHATQYRNDVQFNMMRYFVCIGSTWFALLIAMWSAMGCCMVSFWFRSVLIRQFICNTALSITWCFPHHSPHPLAWLVTRWCIVTWRVGCIH